VERTQLFKPVVDLLQLLGQEVGHETLRGKVNV
jgi:hypothetical protein